MIKTKTPRDIIRRLVQNWAAPVGCGLLFLFLLNFIFFFGYVPSNSMEPTIRKSSYIFGIRVFSELERGDIVVFEHENLLLVKRIAGVPGNVILVDGVERTVPVGHYFMLGDNTVSSVDSRHWAEPFVPRERIIARIFR